MKKKQAVRKAFNDACLERDGRKCKICSSSKELEVHHIFDRRFLPDELKYVPENGISLCNPCHRDAEKFHMSQGKSWAHGLHPDNLYVLIGSSWRVRFWKTFRTSYYD